MLPHITLLQATILSVIMKRHSSGDEVRAAISERYGFEIKGPAFYQLMKRLEEGAGFLKGTMVMKPAQSQMRRHRQYEITAEGLNELQAFFGFVNSLLQVAPGQA